MALFAAALGTAAACQHPAQLWVGSTGEPSRSDVTYQPVPASPLCSPTCCQPHKGTSPAGHGCNHYPKGTLHRLLRGKGTTSLLGLLFPLSYTGNNTNRNNTVKPRGQSAVGIHKHTSHSSVPLHRCLRSTLKYPLAFQLIISQHWIITVRG